MQNRSLPRLASVSLIALSALTGCSTMPGWMGGNSDSASPSSSLQSILNKNYKEALSRAENAYNDGKKEEAIGLYHKASQYEPQEVYPLVQMADILWEMHNTPEVVSVLEHARVISPDHPDVLRNLGRAYVSAGNLKKAQEAYQAALAVTPSDARVLNGLGLAYSLDGNHIEAQKYYRTGLELEPNMADLQNNLGYSLISTGKYDEAIKVLEPLVSGSQATARQRQNLALAYGMLGREDDVARVSSADLSPAEIKRNLMVYEHLRNQSEHGKALNDFGKPSFQNGSLSNKPAKPLPKHIGDNESKEMGVPQKVEPPKEEPAVLLTDTKPADKAAEPVKVPEPKTEKAPEVKLEKASLAQPEEPKDLKAKPDKASTAKADPAKPEAEKTLASASVAMTPIISGPTAKGKTKEEAEKTVSSGLDNGTKLLTAKVDTLVAPAPKVEVKPATDGKPAEPAKKAEAMIDSAPSSQSAPQPATEGARVLPTPTAPKARLVDGKLANEPKVAPEEAKDKLKKDQPVKASAKAKPESSKVLVAPKDAVKTVAKEEAKKAEPAKADQASSMASAPVKESSDAKAQPVAPVLGSAKVFLGTFPTEADARVAWIKVWSAHSASLGSMVANIEPKGDQSNLYAIGAASKEEAAKVCADLKAAGVDCSN